MKPFRRPIYAFIATMMLVFSSVLFLRPETSSAWSLSGIPIVGPLVETGKKTWEKLKEGDLAGAAGAATQGIRTAAKGVISLVKDPSQLGKFAELGLKCAPTAAAAYAQVYTPVITDFSSNGPCTQLISLCNKTVGDLLCPNVDGVRDQLTKACGASGIASQIGSGNQGVQAFVSFCQNGQQGKFAKSDQILGTQPSPGELKVQEKAAAGNEQAASAEYLKLMASKDEQASKMVKEMSYTIRHNSQLSEETKRQIVKELSDINRDLNETIQKVSEIGGKNVELLVNDARSQRDAMERMFSQNAALMDKIVGSNERQIMELISLSRDQLNALVSLNRDQFDKFISLSNAEREGYLQSLNSQSDKFLEVNRLIASLAAEGKRADMEIIRDIMSRLEASDAQKEKIIQEKNAEIEAIVKRFNESLEASDEEKNAATAELQNYVDGLNRQVIAASVFDNYCQSYLTELSKCLRFPNLASCSSVSEAHLNSICKK